MSNVVGLGATNSERAAEGRLQARAIASLNMAEGMKLVVGRFQSRPWKGSNQLCDRRYGCAA